MQEANIYTYLTPIALFFVLIEVGLCLAYRRDYIHFPEAVANFGTALANQTVNVLVAAGVYVIYGCLWENYRLFTIELNWWTFILLLLGVDFIFYWVHRWGHAINILWAAHSPHHSAEEMNFMVALRASVTQRFSSFLFFWPLALIGFQPLHIYMMSGIHLFIAFLHHTEFIGKLGWFEKYFTTPSHHRVHHGVNFPYLDKNFGEFLIIWDKIFGSFAEENEKVVYGIYNHPQSWNPININFHYFIVLWRDAVAAPFLWDKIRVWFMPAGWRPRGLPDKPMIEITTQNQIKYRPLMFDKSRVYILLQLAVGVFLMLGVISNLLKWTTEQRWLGAILLWWHVINWSGVLEARPWLWISENLRILVTAFAVISFNALYQPSGFLFVVIAISAFSFIWTNLYFRPGSPKLEIA
ncbi:MAG TPA: sterol desaturase family protein [Pyrinomonadaceae bacterium]|nr:sterol desaturase family protein [Chloracidobacterium sp.]MBP9935099.1 sterol desaturase family protein [Pyrinomonadaceae bacterium]MBK7803475.1 sterol desaturase family protein [Chloracidobacterium sp.]MBK9438724.1 sterol desaturase family protein [Chloracidobacterium sp.]MBL0241250.1 sterol desaturase family protein [Chloracidobacterium sp.]